MKNRLNMSIRKRIYWSFALLVCLSVINGVITNLTLDSNKKLAIRLSTVVEPSLRSLADFKKMMLESKMYATNWVFLRSNQEDKKLLEKIHASDYPALKSRITIYSSLWANTKWADSIGGIFCDFEELLAVEKSIMTSLQKFDDYNDPVIKFEAERKVDEEIIPRSAALINTLNILYSHGLEARKEANLKLERSSTKLRWLILILALTTICGGLFLSFYMTKVIIRPIKKISSLINDLGRGIIGKIDHRTNQDEMGRMVRSVNNLSEKLQATATFAQQVGLRNFDMAFKPLSDDDTLGKSLIAMRDNLSASERQLLEANSEIQTIFNAVLDAVIIIDEGGFIVKWDHKSEILFGWKEAEVMGTSLSEVIIPHRYRAAHEQGMKHFLKTGEGPILGRTVEVIALKKGNEEFDISLSISPHRMNGKYRFIGFIRDITSRKKAEAELRHSEKRYRQIVETTQEGIWLDDENSCVTFVNKKMAEMLGYSTEEMIGKDDSLFMDEEGRQFSLKTTARRKKGEKEKYEMRFIGKNGEYVFTQIAADPVFDENGIYKGSLAMVTDITQSRLDEELIKKSEVSLEIKNRELEQKNKELEQFAFVASHDLQEPLQTTSSFVDLLLKQYNGRLDEKADKYLQYIGQATDRMQVLITDLLDYSKIGSKERVNQVDCNEVLSEVIHDLDTVIKETGAEIRANILPVVRGCRVEIKQLFQNLAFNAIKFRQKNIPMHLTISARQEKDSWQFSFADNGIGIAKEHNERIFVIFQRLHNRNHYKGSGIGLSHCKKIVQLHKGRIWLESEIGKGTTFYFTIPQKSLMSKPGIE
jgi:PAS domain S-box-containing protein